jgi:hypothetical protein
MRPLVEPWRRVTSPVANIMLDLSALDCGPLGQKVGVETRFVVYSNIFGQVEQLCRTGWFPLRCHPHNSEHGSWSVVCMTPAQLL